MRSLLNSYSEDAGVIVEYDFDAANGKIEYTCTSNPTLSGDITLCIVFL